MRRIYPEFVDFPGAAALLFLRLVAGSALMFHGWPKIQKPFEWMGSDSWAPGILQALAAVSEFGGGLALVLGLLAPIACLSILCTMGTATTMVHMAKGDPFVAPRGWEGGSYELALVYFWVALAIMLIGPGKLSLDYLLFGRKKLLPAPLELTPQSPQPKVESEV